MERIFGGRSRSGAFKGQDSVVECLYLCVLCTHICLLSSIIYTCGSSQFHNCVCPIFLRKPLECLQPPLQPMVEECIVCATKFRHSCSGAYALAENGRELLSITVMSVCGCLPDLSSFECMSTHTMCVSTCGGAGGVCLLLCVKIFPASLAGFLVLPEGRGTLDGFVVILPPSPRTPDSWSPDGSLLVENPQIQT